MRILIMDFDDLSIIDWRIVKKVNDNNRLISLNEIRQETKLPYHIVAYHCSKLKHKKIFECTRSASAFYSMTSSKELRQEVMNRYYDLMDFDGMRV